MNFRSVFSAFSLIKEVAVIDLTEVVSVFLELKGLVNCLRHESFLTLT